MKLSDIDFSKKPKFVDPFTNQHFADASENATLMSPGILSQTINRQNEAISNTQNEKTKEYQAKNDEDISRKKKDMAFIQKVEDYQKQGYEIPDDILRDYEAMKIGTFGTFKRAFKNNMHNYLATFVKQMAGENSFGYKKANLGRQKAQSDFNNAYIQNPITGIAGTILTDPLTYTPAGIVTKGKLGTRVLKTLGAGSALGIGINELHSYGNKDLQDKYDKAQRYQAKIKELKDKGYYIPQEYLDDPLMSISQNKDRVLAGTFGGVANVALGQGLPALIRKIVGKKNKPKVETDEIAKATNQPIGASDKDNALIEAMNKEHFGQAPEVNLLPNETINTIDSLVAKATNQSIASPKPRLKAGLLPSKTRTILPDTLPQNKDELADIRNYAVSKGTNAINEYLAKLPKQTQDDTSSLLQKIIPKKEKNILIPKERNIKKLPTPEEKELLRRELAIVKNPYYNELVKNRQEVLSTQIKYPRNLISRRTIINRANGDVDVAPTQFETNYLADFSTTKQDIKNFRKGKINNELLSKIENDLGVYENDPRYKKLTIDEINEKFQTSVEPDEVLPNIKDFDEDINYNEVIDFFSKKNIDKRINNTNKPKTGNNILYSRGAGTIGGGASGAFVDYDQDGKQTLNDILIGALGGASVDVLLTPRNLQRIKKALDKPDELDIATKKMIKRVNKELDEQISMLKREGMDVASSLPEYTNKMIKKVTGVDINSNIMQGSRPLFNSSTKATKLSKQPKKQYDNNMLDRLIQKAVGKTVKKIDDITFNKISKTINNIKKTDTADAIFGHKIYQAKKYMNMREDLYADTMKEYSGLEILHNQLKEFSEPVRKEMYRYMNGDKYILPDKFKKVMDSYIKQIDDISEELYNLKILTREQVDRFKGHYLHRSYESKIGKNFFGFNKDKTIRATHQRGKQWKGSKKEYLQYLQEGKIGKFNDGKIEAKRRADGRYEFQRDWTKKERAKWGEIEDIAYALPDTIRRSKEMIAHAKFLKKVSESKYIAPENMVSKSTKEELKELGYIQLNGKKFGALDGMYVDKRIAHDISETTRIIGDLDTSFKRLFRDYMTLWKKSHTIYNPTAHWNNLMSNVSFQFMEGNGIYNALKGAKKGLSAYKNYSRVLELQAKQLIGLTKKETRELSDLLFDSDVKLWSEASQRGLFGRSRLNDTLNQFTNKQNVTRSRLSKIDRKVSGLYQSEDNIMRFSLLRYLVEDKGMSIRIAIKKVNRTIPDYSKPMSRRALEARNSSLIPFISFTYHSLPIMLRQLKTRPSRVLALFAGITAINHSFGINPFSEKDSPQGFAFHRIPIFKDGDKVNTLKIDKWFPHSELVNPYEIIRTTLLGGFPQTVLGYINNYNPYFNQKITYRKDTDPLKYYQLAKYGVQNILPSPDVADRAYNLLEAKISTDKKRRHNRVIEPRSSTQELLNLLGLNTLSYDKSKQAQKINSQTVK
jgi:hypothetical protein